MTAKVNTPVHFPVYRRTEKLFLANFKGQNIDDVLTNKGKLLLCKTAILFVTAFNLFRHLSYRYFSTVGAIYPYGFSTTLSLGYRIIGERLIL